MKVAQSEIKDVAVCYCLADGRLSAQDCPDVQAQAIQHHCGFSGPEQEQRLQLSADYSLFAVSCSFRRLALPKNALASDGFGDGHFLQASFCGL